jgi:predicted RNA-binding protein with RPS1 domain
MNQSHYMEADSSQIGLLVEALLDPARTVPVVAITTSPRTDELLLDPSELGEHLGDAAKVVVIRTGEPTWELARALPERLAVYGGHARVWFPKLTRESDVHEHPIIWIYSPRDARAARQRLLDMLTTAPSAQPTQQRASTATRSIGDVISGVVAKIDAAYALVEFDGKRGIVPVHELVQGAEPVPSEVLCAGQRVRAKLVQSDPRNDRYTLSIAKATLQPWERAAELFETGDIVRARVVQVGNLTASLEILPGVIGEIHISRMGLSVVHPSKLFELGATAMVEIVALNPKERSAELSLPTHYDSARVRESEPLLPGGPPFPPDVAAHHRGRADGEEVRKLREEVRQLVRQLDEAARQRRDRVDELTAERIKSRELKRELELERQRTAELERLVLGPDPLESEGNFRHALVRVYEALYTASDRALYPLQPFKVGRKFTAAVRELEIPVEKVIEVCAHVVAGRHDAVPGKLIHPLRASDTGPQRVRESDGAKAWRCALQIESPSARRLHWWVLPSGKGIELASVGVHDDMTIPD